MYVTRNLPPNYSVNDVGLFSYSKAMTVYELI